MKKKRKKGIGREATMVTGNTTVSKLSRNLKGQKTAALVLEKVWQGGKNVSTISTMLRRIIYWTEKIKEKPKWMVLMCVLELLGLKERMLRKNDVNVRNP